MEKKTGSLSFWDKLTALSSISIPIVLVIIGNNFSDALKEKEIRAKYVELAINILNQETNKNEKTKSWAIKIVNEYSSVKIDSLTQNEIIKNEFVSSISQDEMLDFAVQKARQGNFESAIKGYMLAKEKDSLNPQPYNLIGYSYFKMGDYKNALTFLEKSCKLSNDYPWAHYNLSLVYWAVNRKDEAIEEIKKTILLDSFFKNMIARDKQFHDFRGNSKFDEIIMNKSEAKQFNQ
jgi:tetratricopeptide (TPR) repeat protein